MQYSLLQDFSEPLGDYVRCDKKTLDCLVFLNYLITVSFLIDFIIWRPHPPPSFFLKDVSRDYLLHVFLGIAFWRK